MANELFILQFCVFVLEFVCVHVYECEFEGAGVVLPVEDFVCIR